MVEDLVTVVILVSVWFALMRSDKQRQIMSSQHLFRYVRSEIASAAAERIWSAAVL